MKFYSEFTGNKLLRPKALNEKSLNEKSLNEKSLNENQIKKNIAEFLGSFLYENLFLNNFSTEKQRI